MLFYTFLHFSKFSIFKNDLFNFLIFLRWKKQEKINIVKEDVKL